MVTRTLVCPLETSHRKLETIRTIIDEYQMILDRMNDIYASYQPSNYGGKPTTFYNHGANEFPHSERETGSDILLTALREIGIAHKKWADRGFRGSRPTGTMGSGNYCLIESDSLRIESNDRGYGVCIDIYCLDDLWFHIDSAPYHDQYLERVVDDDDGLEVNQSQFHLRGDELYLHLSYSEDVDTRAYADSETILGVDLNVDPLVCVAGIDTETGQYRENSVTMESGGELKHHRERLKKRKATAQSNGNAARVAEPTQQYHNLTKHITEVASRRVIEAAIEHRPAAIHLEDLKGIRESRDLHEWPYGMIRTRIEEKAAEEGIAVKTVDPAYTSKTCRKCGTVNDTLGTDREFVCPNCSYEVHRDVNAAFNIATSEPLETDS